MFDALHGGTLWRVPRCVKGAVSGFHFVRDTLLLL
jgi:hypothetical protein